MENYLSENRTGTMIPGLLGMAYQISIGDRLEQEVKTLRAKLQQTEEALAALHSNPEIERVINLISKVQHIY